MRIEYCPGSGKQPIANYDSEAGFTFEHEAASYGRGRYLCAWCLKLHGVTIKGRIIHHRAVDPREIAVV